MEGEGCLAQNAAWIFPEILLNRSARTGLKENSFRPQGIKSVSKNKNISYYQYDEKSGRLAPPLL
jgi:hypothetical protein